MTAINGNPLTSMLNGAFGKFDRNGDGKINGDEVSAFDEMLRPGVPTDGMGRPKFNYSDRMDQDGDSAVTREEMSSATVLMPANLTDTNFSRMVSYLQDQNTKEAFLAASILMDNGDV
ncbi:hypothetical protein E2F50_03770 [Rhizobium deserti]|uniref:EF-hand domain-containing protein n=1 Tax=Rhizobium deserti TaxID=2547961 RepID=A0A4R5UN14_9HYPH|nr:EF-hand domain-containing protein [Rhizobium deserti]TDK39251.1 hypothetical protein E2F50_03770 [Rhizobium deserti]